MCFSGRKDSALVLRALQQQDQYDVVELLTTVTSEYDRVSMHGVRRVLLHQQVTSLGLPLTEVSVPPMSSNEIYEHAMRTALEKFHARGIRRIAFGDIFLDDLRVYRESRTAEADFTCLFPIWRRDTTDLALGFIRDGFRAVVVCVDPELLDLSFAGRPFHEALIADLPADVNPCGENGEFHTFVWDGPIFQHPIPVSTGAVVERDGFVFCDVLPRDTSRGIPALSTGDQP